MSRLKKFQFLGLKENQSTGFIPTELMRFENARLRDNVEVWFMVTFEQEQIGAFQVSLLFNRADIGHDTGKLIWPLNKVMSATHLNGIFACSLNEFLNTHEPESLLEKLMEEALVRSLQEKILFSYDRENEHIEVLVKTGTNTNGAKYPYNDTVGNFFEVIE